MSICSRLPCQNIIDNACKYSPDHTVGIKFQYVDKGIEIIFEDRGIGISEEDLGGYLSPFTGVPIPSPFLVVG